MSSYNKNDFFKLYRIFFIVNLCVSAIFVTICIFVPDAFDFLGHKLRVCDKNIGFAEGLLTFWLWDIVPACVLFLSGITIYTPLISIAASALNGVILALDIYAFFSDYNIMFSITMVFIRLCGSWLTVWYFSYVSAACIRLYSTNMPFSHGLTFDFLGKYIIWFIIFALFLFALDTAQCFMFRL